MLSQVGGVVGYAPLHRRIFAGKETDLHCRLSAIGLAQARSEHLPVSRHALSAQGSAMAHQPFERFFGQLKGKSRQQKEPDNERPARPVILVKVTDLTALKP